jgi:hypothetical protein
VLKGSKIGSQYWPEAVKRPYASIKLIEAFLNLDSIHSKEFRVIQAQGLQLPCISVCAS